MGYEICVLATRKLLEEIRTGKCSKITEITERKNCGYYILWPSDKQNEIWIEVPDQVLDKIVEGFEDIVKQVERGKIGYYFLPSAFIKIQVNSH
mgnify:CR=1 FL=1